MEYSQDTRRYLAKVSRIGMVAAILYALIHGFLQFFPVFGSIKFRFHLLTIGVYNVIPELAVAGTVTLTFRDAARLSPKTNQIPAGVFLYREDGSSYEVSCRLEGSTVRFEIPAGETATAVGYGRRNYSHANLMNEKNLPVTPFYVGLK